MEKEKEILIALSSTCHTVWGIWCEADEVQDPVSVKQTHFTVAGGKENGSVKFWQPKWDKSVWEPAINCLCVFQFLEAFYFIRSVVKGWYKLLADADSSVSTLKSPCRGGEKGGKKKDFQDVLSVLSNEQNTQDMETSQSFIPSTDLQS